MDLASVKGDCAQPWIVKDEEGGSPPPVYMKRRPLFTRPCLKLGMFELLTVALSVVMMFMVFTGTLFFYLHKCLSETLNFETRIDTI
jgi:hypothetical protein